MGGAPERTRAMLALSLALLLLLLLLPLLSRASEPPYSGRFDSVDPDDDSPRPPIPIDAGDFLLKELSDARLQVGTLVQSGRADSAWGEEQRLAAAYAGMPFIFLWPDERDALALLSGRWDVALDSARWRPGFSSAYMDKFAPYPDHLLDTLERKLFVDRNRVRSSIAASGLESDRKDFLEILLLHLANRHAGKAEPGRQELSRLADRYLERYPGTLYTTVLLGIIRPVYAPALVGFGMDVNSAAYFPMGGYGRMFGRGAGLGFGFSILIGPAFLRGYLAGDPWATLDADTRAKGHEWISGDDLALTFLEAQFGFSIPAGRWKLSPYGIWGSLEASNLGLEKALGKDSNEARVFPIHWGWGLRAQRFFSDDIWNQVGFLGLAAGMRHLRMESELEGASGGEAYLEFQAGLDLRKSRRKW